MSEDVMHVDDKLVREIEMHLSQLINIPSTNPLIVQIRALLEMVIMAGNSKDITSTAALVQKVGHSHI